MLIYKKKIKINEKFFIISMIPAYYALELIPYFENLIKNPPECYETIKEFMFKIFSYCRLVDNGKILKITEEIMNSINPKDLQVLQEKLIYYNQDFLEHGRS